MLGFEHKRCGADSDASYGSTGAPQVATPGWMATTKHNGFIRWSTSEPKHSYNFSSFSRNVL
ncbi:hypothetical protein [Methanohalobium evestigatum]|uniref:hypothetical protein n=1 Tax=Methanohalobium evestigatum TaxID=2322 RepID=UPI0012F6B256|nr:hypothetical protein [Methanohalobium evestigatum]